MKYYLHFTKCLRRKVERYWGNWQRHSEANIEIINNKIGTREYISDRLFPLNDGWGHAYLEPNDILPRRKEY